MKKFVFQGDSITDSNRSREDGTWNLGYGYPDLVAADLSFKYPGEFQFINEGVSGDKTANMYARITEDVLEHKPDYVSVLIGVNDAWHPISNNRSSIFSVERYTQLLSMFIEDILEKNPKTIIAVIEPAILDEAPIHAYFEAFDNAVRERAQAAKDVAEKYNLIFVPIKEKLEELCKTHPAECWLIDGVHPTQAGHRLIANELIKALGL